MKWCLLILIIVILLYQISKKRIEGFDAPARSISGDLKDYIKVGTGGILELTDEAKKKLNASTSKVSNPKQILK